MNLRCFFLTLLLGAPVLAEGPAGYAYGWPLVQEGESQAWQVELSPEVYAAAVDPELRDVEVFDARGEAVPVGPLVQDPRHLPSLLEPVPVFELRRGVDDDAASLRLRIERGRQGATRVDASWAEEKQEAPPRDFLLGLGPRETPIDGIVIEGEGVFHFRFVVEASADLERWRTVVASASVLRIVRGGETLERLEVELPPTRSPYLRLRRMEGEPPAAFRAKVRRASTPSRTPLRWTEAQLVRESIEIVAGRKLGVHLYEIPGPLPVERLRLLPSSEASLAKVRVEAQQAEDSPAIEVARFDAVGVEVEGVELPPAEIRFRAVSSASWRVESSPPLPAPPRLSLGYRPLRLVYLSQGHGPHLLAAGSHERRRTDAPTSTLLLQVGRRQGQPWEPPAAQLGDRITLEGEAARRAPIQWQRPVLWAILVTGAGLVALLALRLLRKPAPES